MTELTSREQYDTKPTLEPAEPSWFSNVFAKARGLFVSEKSKNQISIVSGQTENQNPYSSAMTREVAYTVHDALQQIPSQAATPETMAQVAYETAVEFYRSKGFDAQAAIIARRNQPEIDTELAKLTRTELPQ